MTSQGIRGIHPFADEYTNMWYTEYIRGDDYNAFMRGQRASSSGRRQDRTFARLINMQVQLMNRADFLRYRNDPAASPWFEVSPYPPQ